MIAHDSLIAAATAASAEPAPALIAFSRPFFGEAEAAAAAAAVRSGWIVASLSTAAMVAFIPSLQMTSVANVAVIIATQPFIAAGLAFLWFREAARWRTMLASLVAFVGVVITVSQSVTSADLGELRLPSSWCFRSRS